MKKSIVQKLFYLLLTVALTIVPFTVFAQDKAKTTVSNLEYTQSQDGTASVTASVPDEKGVYIVLSSVTINGKDIPVTKIEKNVFASDIKAVVIPDSVKALDSSMIKEETGTVTQDNTKPVVYCNASNKAVKALGNTVAIQSDSIKLTSLELTAGDKKQCVYAIPDEFSTDTITWASDNTGIATVDSNGMVTAVSSGNATITATVDGLKGTTSLQVAANEQAAPTASTAESTTPTVTAPSVSPTAAPSVSTPTAEPENTAVQDSGNTDSTPSATPSTTDDSIISNKDIKTDLSPDVVESDHPDTTAAAPSANQSIVSQALSSLADLTTQSYTSGLYQYTVTNNQATITKYTGSEGSVFVPSTLGGYPVTAIGTATDAQHNGVFDGNNSIVSVTIPDSVTYIGNDAFEDCSNLTNFKMGNGVTSLGDYAFAYCSSLKTLNLSRSLKKIQGCVFIGCTSLSNVTIPSSVQYIETSAFFGCSSSLNLTFESPMIKQDGGAYVTANHVVVKADFDYDKAKAQLVMVNNERANYGKAALVMDNYLTEQAMIRATELCLYYSHTQPTGLDYTSNTTKVENENITADRYSGTMTAYSAFNMFNKSPLHHQTMVNSSYKTIGIGIASSNGVYGCAQEYSVSSSATAVQNSGVIARNQVIYFSPSTTSVTMKVGTEADGPKDSMSLSKGSSANLVSYVVSSNSTYVSGAALKAASTWTSSNTSVAGVNSNGTVTAYQPGTTTITATSGNVSKSMTLTVTGSSSTNVPLTGLVLDKSSVTLSVGNSTSLTATKQPSNTTDRGAISWSSTNSSVASVDAKGKITAKSAGTAVISASCNGKIAQCVVTVISNINPTQPNVYYQTHVQDIGWQSPRYNGDTSGTSGQSKRLEGIYIGVSNMTGTSVSYRTHIQDIGWQDWKSQGTLSGTIGQSKRLEAIQVKLTGTQAANYDIYYRVHAQNFGWLDWAKDGAAAGTEGYGLRLEAIQIVLVKKGNAVPGATANPFVSNYTTGNVRYTTHVQDIGWQNYVSDGALAGTTGQSKRLEGICVSLSSNIDGGIEYTTHVQNIGWQSGMRANGQMAGTQGQSLRLEAIRIRLTGNAANLYDVYYQVHCQNFGWLGWAKNGADSGSAGFGYRLEGIHIVLVPKGGSAPGSTVNAFIQH